MTNAQQPMEHCPEGLRKERKRGGKRGWKKRRERLGRPKGGSVGRSVRIMGERRENGPEEHSIEFREGEGKGGGTEAKKESKARPKPLSIESARGVICCPSRSNISPSCARGEKKEEEKAFTNAENGKVTDELTL